MAGIVVAGVVGTWAPVQAQNALTDLGSGLVASAKLPDRPLDLALTVVGPETLTSGLIHVISETIAARRPGSTLQRVGSPEVRHSSEYQLVAHVALINHTIVVTMEAFSYRGSRTEGEFEPERDTVTSYDVRLPLDAQLRAMLGSEAPTLPMVTEGSVRPRRARLRRKNYLAVAVHDFDRDGVNELALVRESEIEIARLHRTERGFRSEHVVTLDLGDFPRSNTRSRRPIAVAAQMEGATEHGVLVRTSEHASMIHVHFEAERMHAVPHALGCAGDGFPSGTACAVRVRGRDYFQAELLARERSVDLAVNPEPTPPSPPSPAPSGFYSRAVEVLRQADGTEITYQIIATPRGRLVSRAGGRQSGAPGYGSALGLADVDQDGNAEIIASSAAPLHSADRLRLLRMNPQGQLRLVWELNPLQGSVTVAGAGM